MSPAKVADSQSVTKKWSSIPAPVREVMEQHLDGLDGPPTVALVKSICEDPAVSSNKSELLKYFLVESPLRARELGVVLSGNLGQAIAFQVCQDAAKKRDKNLANGVKPRWEEAVLS